MPARAHTLTMLLSLALTFLGDEPPNQRPDDLVRPSERHALPHQVVGHVGGQQQAGRRGFGALTVVAPWDRPEDLLAVLVRSNPQASRRSGRVR